MAKAKGQALINEITAEYLQDRPSFRAGDTVKVFVKITESKEHRPMPLPLKLLLRLVCCLAESF